MDKITEIIPDDIPQWAAEAIERGDFFRVAIAKAEAADKHQTAEVSPSKSSDLLCCPECGKDAKDCCIANQTKAREPHEKNRGSMRCNNCGYTVTVQTRRSPVVVRKLWNIRAI